MAPQFTRSDGWAAGYRVPPLQRLAYKPKNQNAQWEYQSVPVEAHAAGYGKVAVELAAVTIPGDHALRTALHHRSFRRAPQLRRHLDLNDVVFNSVHNQIANRVQA